MQKYIFSADKNAFFPVELKIAYQEAGKWPDDGIEIDDTAAAEFMKEAPEGKGTVANTGIRADNNLTGTFINNHLVCNLNIFLFSIKLQIVFQFL